MCHLPPRLFFFMAATLQPVRWKGPLLWSLCSMPRARSWEQGSRVWLCEGGPACLPPFFVAVCPAHLAYSQYAHTDQHVAESCWGFLALAAFLWACRKNEKRLEAAAGIFLTLAVLTWQGSIFWSGIFAVAITADLFGKNRARCSAGRFWFWVFLRSPLLWPHNTGYPDSKFPLPTSPSDGFSLCS